LKAWLVISPAKMPHGTGEFRILKTRSIMNSRIPKMCHAIKTRFGKGVFDNQETARGVVPPMTISPTIAGIKKDPGKCLWVYE
jgi:hypothetical protein